MTERLVSVAEKFNVITRVALGDDGAPKPSEEDEQTSSISEGVRLVFGETLDAGVGRLYITSKRVVWVGTSHPNLTFQLSYPQIVMHAVSRDTSSFPHACIYLQLDEGEDDEAMLAAAGHSQEDGEDNDQDDVPAELRLVPADASKIDDLFKALCDCAALNPDPDAEDGEGDFFFDEAEVYSGLDDGTRAQLVALRMEGGAMALDEEGEEGDLDELVGEDPSRFEDDEDVEAAGANGHA